MTKQRSQPVFSRLISLVLLLAVAFGPSLVYASSDAGDIQDSIDSIESKLKKEQKQYDAIAENLNQVTSSLNATQAAIYKVQALLKATNQTIDQKKEEIASLESQQELNRRVLSNLIQELYYNNKTPLVEVVLAEADVQGILETGDNLFSTQEKVQNLISDINDTKDQINQEKASLEEVKQDHEDLLAIQQQQKSGLVSQQQEVQQNLNEQEATISELNQKLTKLRSDLSSLLGKNLSTDDIVAAAKIAGKATGVRKDFILGELVVETDLGRFTGGCYYSKGSNPVGKHMKAADKTAFLGIMDDLGYGNNDKKLSCWPGYGYGGAMGVAQFMPTTWNGYKSKIASATGHKTPDPWNIVDGVMGMAIKLANAGATKKSGERTASKVYYCGGSSSPYWKTKCEDYADKVQYWADNYEKKL